VANLNLVKSFLGLTLIGAEWVLWVLVCLSVLSVAIIFERSLFFFRTRQNFLAFNVALMDYLKRGEFSQAEGLCSSSPSLAARVALQGIRNRQISSEAMGSSMDAMIVGERSKLDRGLVVLGTLGNNAPFIGLFGTVIGIIKAFHDLALNPQGGPSIVMAGISEALVATAVGLLVAIPAVIAFNAFTRLVKNQVADAQSLSKLLMVYHSPRSEKE
jgi:biopolymer transport protein ExbB